MPLLITGGNSGLARAVANALAEEHSIRLIDTRFTTPPPPGADIREGDLRDRDFVKAALADVDAVLHLGALFPSGATETETLDETTRGTYVLATAAIEAGVQRFVLGSSLGLFDRLPAAWKVMENWRPRPEPRLEHLCPWLAELSVQECARVSAMRAICLRFGQIVDEAEAAAQPYDPRWLHRDDAVAAARCALAYGGDQPPWWSVFHIAAAGKNTKMRVAEAGNESFGYRPTRDFEGTENREQGTEPITQLPNDPITQLPNIPSWQEILASPQPIASRPIRKVVIFGAGGPVAAALALELAASYTLRLTDVRPIEEIAKEGKPQSPGAPLPVPLPAPHECRVVDVRDPEQVMAACEGMDAIINLTVVRPDPVEAFRVNTLGAYNIVRAAVAHNIRRVVQTGPAQILLQDPGSYWANYDLSADAPARPTTQLYFHTKYLGQEIGRVFADYYDLEIPVLLYCQFANPETEQGLNPFAISWQDSARSLRRALEVRSLPSPYEVFNILADLPHGKYTNQKAKLLLDWEPRDSMEHLWDRV